MAKKISEAAPSDADAPEPESAPEVSQPDHGSSPEATAPRSTRAGRFWVTLAFTGAVIVLLIIFIAENSQRVTIHFLGAKGSISAALALLIAAVAGALIMLLVGTTRILQLRREVKRLL